MLTRRLLSSRIPWLLAPLSLALLTALLLAGCGGGGGTTPTTTAPLPLSEAATTANGLTATFAEDRTTISVGQAVNYTLTLTNNTASPITFFPLTGALIGWPAVGGSVLIKDANGKIISPVQIPAITDTGGPSTTLAPGQSASSTQSSGAVFPGPGRYFATASFALSTSATAVPQATTVGPLEVDVQ